MSAGGAARFAIRYSTLGRAVLVPLGLGPRASWVEVLDTVVRIRMGWAFKTTIPRSAIAAVREGKRILLTTGVHGCRGDWLVNGAGTGIVELELTPRVPARIVGFGKTRLRRLRVSLEDPEGFLEALGV